MRSYIDLLSHRGVGRLVAVAIATRVTVPMLGLGLVLAVVAAHGSYADGGLVLASFSLAAAFFSPVNGRMVDRLGARRVLSVLLPANMAAYTALVVALTRDAPLGALMTCAFLVGGSNPPAGSIVRSTWALLVPEERLHTAFALDAVLNEVMFVSGPLLVSLLVFFGPPLAAVIVVGAGVLTGNLLLVTTPGVRDRAPDGGGAKRHYLGPLAHGQTRLLYAILVCDTFAFGSLIVSVPAAATARGEQDVAGVLLSALSVGSVIGGLIYGTRRRGGSAGRELALFNGASAVLLLGLGRFSALPVIGLILLGFGLVGGPRDTLHQLVLGDVASPRYRTETYAWMSTFMLVGYSIGTAAAGRLVGHSGQDTAQAFLASAAAIAIAAMLSLLVRTVPADATPVPAGDRTKDHDGV